MSAPRSPDTPFLGDGNDTFRVQDRYSLPISTESDVGGLVHNAVEAMAAGGDTAEDTYQRTLRDLRDRGDEAVRALGATYQTLQEDRYLERWSVVQLLTDLRVRSAVEVLADVLRQPVPEERSDDPAHGLSTVGEEILIRTTAVEALGRLVADGDRRAREVLQDQVRHGVFSVRRAAVQAARDSGDQPLIGEVGSILRDAGEEWLLEIRRPNVREVPQADGRQFLREREPAGTSTPPEPRS